MPIEEPKDEKIDDKHSSSSFEKRLKEINGQPKASDHLSKPRPTVIKKRSYMNNNEIATEILSNDSRVEEHLMKQSMMSKMTRY